MIPSSEHHGNSNWFFSGFLEFSEMYYNLNGVVVYDDVVAEVVVGITPVIAYKVD